MKPLNPIFPTIVFALIVAALLLFAPVEDVAAYILVAIGLAVGVGGLSLVRDPDERRLLLRLFLFAFALRVAFTIFLYKTGLTENSALGGVDDSWQISWAKAGFWHGFGPDAQYRKPIPDSFLGLFNRKVTYNVGYFYFGAVVYYLLYVPSQMALSMINCLANTLTVLIVFKVTYDAWSRKSAIFIGLVAAVLPGFLAWSAISSKEASAILLNATAFFAIFQFSRTKSAFYLALAVLAMTLIYTLRFYATYFIFVGISVSYLCFRAQRPLRTLGFCALAMIFGYVMGSGFGLIHFDPTTIVMEQIEEARHFAGGLAHSSGRSASGVALSFDVHTPVGILKTLGVGAAYLLFSPFPWEGLGGRQIYALPDILLWWTLILVFMIPGFRLLWRERLPLLLSIIVFVLPLMLIYSIGFGNVGVAFRQRAQLMPYFLLIAAAGYEARLRQRAARRVRESGAAGQSGQIDEKVRPKDGVLSRA